MVNPLSPVYLSLENSPGRTDNYHCRQLFYYELKYYQNLATRRCEVNLGF